MQPDVDSGTKVWNPGRRRHHWCSCTYEQRQVFWDDVRYFRLLAALGLFVVILRLSFVHILHASWNSATGSSSFGHASDFDELKYHRPDADSGWSSEDGLPHIGSQEDEALHGWYHGEDPIEADVIGNLAATGQDGLEPNGNSGQARRMSQTDATSTRASAWIHEQQTEFGEEMLDCGGDPSCGSQRAAEPQAEGHPVRELDGLGKKDTDSDKSDFSIRMMLWITLPLSITLCLALMLNYVTDKTRRRHPASLVLGRSIYDAICCVSLLTSMIVLDRDSKRDGGSDASLGEEDLCRPFSFFVEFASLGAEFYVLMLSLDFMIAVSNPFTNFRYNRGRYHLGVLVFSAAMSLTMVLMEGGYHKGAPSFWGEDKVLGICWIRRDKGDSDPTNVLFFFVAPMCFVFVIALYAVMFANQRLGQGLPATLQTRLQVFRTHIAFVGSYVVYWIVFAAAYIGSLQIKTSDKDKQKAPKFGIAMILAIAVGSRGIVTGIIWFVSRDVITCLCAKGDSTGPGSRSRRRTGRANDLNVALRKEILFYTTFGIRKSVKYAGRFPKCDRTGGVNPNSVSARYQGGAQSVGIHYNRILLTREFEAGSWTRLRRGQAARDRQRRNRRRRRSAAEEAEADIGSASSSAVPAPKPLSSALLEGGPGSTEKQSRQIHKAIRAIKVSDTGSYPRDGSGIGRLVRRTTGVGQGGANGSYVPPTQGLQVQPTDAAVRAGAGGRKGIRPGRGAVIHAAGGAIRRGKQALRSLGGALDIRGHQETAGGHGQTGGESWAVASHGATGGGSNGAASETRRETTISLPPMDSAQPRAMVRAQTAIPGRGSPFASAGSGVDPMLAELGVVGAADTQPGRGATVGFAAEGVRSRRVGVPPGISRSRTGGAVPRRSSASLMQYKKEVERERRGSGESSESDFVAGLGNYEELRFEQEREEQAAMAGAADIPLALVGGGSGMGSRGGAGGASVGVAGALNAALGLGRPDSTEQSKGISALVNPDGARSDVEVTSSSSSSSSSSGRSSESGGGSESGSQSGTVRSVRGSRGAPIADQENADQDGDRQALEAGMRLLRGPSDGLRPPDDISAEQGQDPQRAGSPQGSEAGSRLASIGASDSDEVHEQPGDQAPHGRSPGPGDDCLPSTSLATTSTALGRGGDRHPRGPPDGIAAAVAIPSTGLGVAAVLHGQLRPAPPAASPADMDLEGTLDDRYVAAATSAGGTHPVGSVPVNSFHSLNGEDPAVSALRIRATPGEDGSSPNHGTPDLGRDSPAPGGLTLEDAWDTAHGVADLHPPVGHNLDATEAQELRAGLLGTGTGVHVHTGIASRLAMHHARVKGADEAGSSSHARDSSPGTASGGGKGHGAGEGTTASLSTRHNHHSRRHSHSRHAHHGRHHRHHSSHRGHGHHGKKTEDVQTRYSRMYGGYGPGHFIGGFGGDQTLIDLELFGKQWDRIRRWMQLEERWRHSERKRQHRLRRLRDAPQDDAPAQARLRELVAPHPRPVPGSSVDAAAPYERTDLPKMSKGAGSFWESCLEDTIFGEVLQYLTCGNLLGCDDDQAFVFRDYEPHIFKMIREQDGIDQGAYESALGETRREKFSEGASGAFLYFSGDERFIVKTMQKEECDQLLAMLKDYQEHMQQYPDSLLTRFYGCHSLRMYGHVMYFVVMGNVFITQGKTIHERFDLKGSWVNRHRQPVEKGKQMECRYCNQKFTVGDRREDGMCSARPNRNHEPNNVSKDNDLNFKLRLDHTTTRAVGDTIIADTNFLRDHGIMDYSLLLGIHRETYHLMEYDGNNNDGIVSGGGGSSEVSGKRGSGTGKSGISDGKPPRPGRSQTISHVRGVVAVSTESKLGQWATEDAKKEEQFIGEEGMPELGPVGTAGGRSATFSAGDVASAGGSYSGWHTGSLPTDGAGPGPTHGSLRSHGSSLRMGSSLTHRPSPLRSAVLPSRGYGGRSKRSDGGRGDRRRGSRGLGGRYSGLEVRTSSGAFHGSKVVDHGGQQRGILRRLDTPKAQPEGGAGGDHRDRDISSRVRRMPTEGGMTSWGLYVGSPRGGGHGDSGMGGSAWGLHYPSTPASEDHRGLGYRGTHLDETSRAVGVQEDDDEADLERLRRGGRGRGSGRGEEQTARADADDMQDMLGLAVGGFARELREEMCDGVDEGGGKQEGDSPPRGGGGVYDEEALGILAGSAVWSDARGMAVVDEDAARWPKDGDSPADGTEDLGPVLHSASHKKHRRPREREAYEQKLDPADAPAPAVVGLRQVPSRSSLAQQQAGGPVALQPPRYSRVRSVLGRESMFSGRLSEAGAGAAGSGGASASAVGGRGTERRGSEVMGQLRHRRRHTRGTDRDGAGSSQRGKSSPRGGDNPAAVEEGRVAGVPQFKTFYGGLRAAMVESPGIYYMGVIDILQAFTLEKRMERFVKTYFLCKDPLGISAIEPRQYASRFRRRVVYQCLDHYEPSAEQQDLDAEDEELDQEELEQMGCLGALFRCEGDDHEEDAGTLTQHQRVAMLRGGQGRHGRRGSVQGGAWGVSVPPQRGTRQSSAFPARGAAGRPRHGSVDYSRGGPAAPKRAVSGRYGRQQGEGDDMSRPLLRD